MDIKNEMLWRIYGVLLGVILFALLIFGRAVKISVFEGEGWRALRDKESVKYVPVEADRGNIIAEDGSLLATSLPFFNIHVDLNSDAMTQQDFDKYKDSLAYCLATYVDNSYTPGAYAQRLVDARTAKNRYLLIKKGATFQEVEAIKKFPLFNLGRYKGGIIIEQDNRRDRPFRMLAHRTIGYIRPGIKPIGLEGAFDDVLKGDEGQRLVRRVAGDVWIPVNDLTEVNARGGKDIKTTIDINLQDIVENALLDGVKKHDAEYGTAILMEVQTGAVRAIANIGKHEQGWWENYNYGIGTLIEPGSTFKLATVMALMEDGYVSLEDTVTLNKGKTKYYEDEMVDSYNHGLDSTTAQRAFEISSNVGISKLANRYYGKKENAKKFINRLKDMNLSLPTGIEVPGEQPPFIKDPEDPSSDWSGTTIPWMSIGYELLLTPLQLLQFYNGVANDGVIMKPYLVSEVQDFGQTVETFKPVVVNRRMASKSTVDNAKILLEGVVESGTGKLLWTDRYRFAGKTGTAQVGYKRLKNGGRMRYQSSFVGYFPAEKPLYSCIVVINDPKLGGFYGGEVAGPIFRKIADDCFSTKIDMHEPLNAKPKQPLAKAKLPSYEAGNKYDMGVLLKYMQLPYRNETSSKAEWAYLQAKEDTLFVKPKAMKENVVPSVVGMGLRDALYALENRGLRVRVNGVGKVSTQSILPGTKAHGQTVDLKLN
jgi:cell division protein FtsI (penicillin-binding protein 3)